MEDSDYKEEARLRIERFEEWQLRQKKAAKKRIKEILISFGVWGLTIVYWLRFPLLRYSESYEAREINSHRIVIWLVILIIAIFLTNRWVIREWNKNDLSRYLSQFAICVFATMGMWGVFDTINTGMTQIYPHEDYADMLLLAGSLLAAGATLTVAIRCSRRNR